MPEYPFICPKCSTKVVITEPMTAIHETDCPECGKHLDSDNGRLWFGVPDHWKCGGAHKVDYRERP